MPTCLHGPLSFNMNRMRLFDPVGGKSLSA
jgi:hypothetical protein